jgi:hypothetical protein
VHLGTGALEQARERNPGLQLRQGLQAEGLRIDNSFERARMGEIVLTKLRYIERTCSRRLLARLRHS